MNCEVKIMERIGLVLEGGGVRGAFTAGALAWLKDHNISFDYSVGISSGAVYLTCFLADNIKAARMMSTKYAAGPECVGFQAFLKEGHYVAYKYIFDVCLKEKEGLTMEPIREANPDMEVGAYDLGRGETCWFGPSDLDDDLVLLRGTCALPLASAVVEWNGRRLLDGGITKMVPIERAQEKGCTKFLVITTKPRDYIRKPAAPMVEGLMKFFYKECPQAADDYHIRHLNYNKQMDIVRTLADEKKAILVCPSKTIKVSRWKGDEDKCRELYQLGYDDMEALKDELLAFLQKDDTEAIA